MNTSNTAKRANMMKFYCDRESIEIDLNFFDLVNPDNRNLDETTFRELQYCSENLFNLSVSFEENILQKYSSEDPYPYDYREIYTREKSRTEFKSYDHLIRISSFPQSPSSPAATTTSAPKKSKVCNSKELEDISEFLYPYIDSFVIAGSGVLESFIILDEPTYDLYFYKDKIKDVLDFVSSKSPVYYSDENYYFFQMFFQMSHISVRIFPYLYSSPSEIAHSFSVDCECIIYSPSKFKIYCTERCKYALENQTNYMKFDNYSSRILKYKCFGFSIPYGNQICDISSIHNSLKDIGCKTDGIYGLISDFYADFYDDSLNVYKQYPYNIQFQLDERPKNQIIENPLKWVFPYEMKIFNLDQDKSKKLRIFSHEEFREAIKCDDEVVYENLSCNVFKKRYSLVSEFLMQMVEQGCILTDKSAIQAFMNYAVSYNINIYSNDNDIQCKYMQFLKDRYELLEYDDDFTDELCEKIVNMYPLVLNLEDEDLTEYYNISCENHSKMMSVADSRCNFGIIKIDNLCKSQKDMQTYGILGNIPFENLMLTREGVICSEFTIEMIKNRIYDGDLNGFKHLGLNQNFKKEAITFQHISGNKISLYAYLSVKNSGILRHDIEKFVLKLSDTDCSYGSFKILKKLIELEIIDFDKMTIKYGSDVRKINPKTLLYMKKLLDRFRKIEKGGKGEKGGKREMEENEETKYKGISFQSFTIPIKVTLEMLLNSIENDIEFKPYREFRPYSSKNESCKNDQSESDQESNESDRESNQSDDEKVSFLCKKINIDCESESDNESSKMFDDEEELQVPKKMEKIENTVKKSILVPDRKKKLFTELEDY